MKKAHGGKIIERILDKKSADFLKKSSSQLPGIPLNHDKIQEVIKYQKF